MEEVFSGDTLIARYDDLIFQINLACIEATKDNTSRQVLENNIGTANGQIKLNQTGVIFPSPDRPAQLIAEVFVDLEDGPQSLNEAQETSSKE